MGRSWQPPPSGDRHGSTSTRSPMARWVLTRAGPSTSWCTSEARGCSTWSRSTGPVTEPGRPTPTWDWWWRPWPGSAAWAMSLR
eukprot:932203-Lingulodinium_polyedra.AAC.1